LEGFHQLQGRGVPEITSPIPGDDSTFQSFRATANVKDQDGRPIAPGASFGNPFQRVAWFKGNMVPKWRDWRKGHERIIVQDLLNGDYSE
jgi:hypothetical protein